MTKPGKGPHWAITSPTGDTYSVSADDVWLQNDVVDAADCNDPTAPMKRVYGDLTITAVIRAGAAVEND